ncbi:NAD(P)-dependent oxidoreductase [Candidatus Parcubacteria bacterium]|nr:MAG: NAD(P)-dependent oxidoreductase [Candidatus Parcubacteria bacterium]
MKIAVIGASGLIGTRLVSFLKEKFEIVELSRSRGFDVVNRESVQKVLSDINPSIILHLAAKTNVDECEKDKENDLKKLVELSLINQKSNLISFGQINPLDWRDENSAFSINTVGTKNLVDFSLKNNSKLIYISTDFVFSGNEEYYTEESLSSPINWYGQTKFWGEEFVNLLPNPLIVRLSYLYGYRNNIKKDFVWKIMELLEAKKEISLVFDQIITPTFIDDIVFGLKLLIEKEAVGTYHLVGESFLSPFEIGQEITQIFSFETSKIKKVTGDEFYQNRAKRPFQTRLKNDKLEKLGFKTKTFKEALILIKNNLSGTL